MVACLNEFITVELSTFMISYLHHDPPNLDKSILQLLCFAFGGLLRGLVLNIIAFLTGESR